MSASLDGVAQDRNLEKLVPPRPEFWSLASPGLVNDRYRVDFYEIAWGHYCNADHHIRRLVISK